MMDRGGYTSILGRGGQLDTLAPDECRQLLESSQLGRLAYCTDFGPQILPVDYLLTGGFLTFRIGTGTEAARHLPSHTVAFEVDQFDASSQTGWSVVVRGTARLLDYSAVRTLTIPPTPRRWPEGQRPLVLRLGLEEMTGRRVRPG